jgi:hypothetical protein
VLRQLWKYPCQTPAISRIIIWEFFTTLAFGDLLWEPLVHEKPLVWLRIQALPLCWHVLTPSYHATSISAYRGSFLEEHRLTPEPSHNPYVLSITPTCLLRD